MAEDLIERLDLHVIRGPSEAQLLLHCEPLVAEPLGRATDFALPARMLRAMPSGDWHALHLAPDEWLLIGPPVEVETVCARFASVVEIAHSLVDVSDRSFSIMITGHAAARLLNVGCPLDFADESFPVGACSRTLLGKAMVMLWRISADAYRIDYARSFNSYVVDYVQAAADDLSTR